MFTHGENPSESLGLTMKITLTQLSGHKASQVQLSRFTEHRGSEVWVSGFRDRLKLKFTNQSKINGCVQLRNTKLNKTNSTIFQVLILDRG